MDSEVLASDPLTKTQTIFHPNNDDAGSYVLEERQDVTDLVEHNKAIYNSIDERARFGNFARVAEIPMSVFLEQYKKGLFRGAKLSKDDKKFLNDPDNRFFRTRPGRV